MYAIVKTGGKQYKVAPGDKLNIEKLDVEPGEKVELQAICVVDGDKIEADPEKAAATKVTAVVLEQFRDKKQLVFKFKKRKNYKKMRGHRQYLTRIQIESVGSEKMEKPAGKLEAAKKEEAASAKPAKEEAAEKKPAAKKSSIKAADEKKPVAEKTAKTKAAASKAAEEKPETASADAE